MGGGVYQLLNELGVPVEKRAEALGTEPAAEGAFTLFNDLGIVQVAHLPAGGCGGGAGGARAECGCMNEQISHHGCARDRPWCPPNS